MSLDELKELIQFMEKHGLLEIEIEQDGRRVRLRKADIAPMIAAAPAGAASPLADPVNGGRPAAPVPGKTPAASAAPAEAPGLIEIKSPMVGTFYRASNPEAKPLVNVGDPIGPDTVVCIIEAMKVMNEVPSGVAGTVQEVCVENGVAVEYGQTLFRVRP
jgi:acetyl-CoA carboxylase biotin carboxyl carrier protein